MSTHFNETWQRSLSKVLTWRIVQIIVITTNTFIVTGNLTLGVQLALVALIINSGIYWLHERFWNTFDWKRLHHDRVRFTERQIRTVGKMITWRILMIVSLYLIAFVTTGNWAASLTIMSFTILFNIFAYWAHERVWNSIRWGKQEYVTE